MEELDFSKYEIRLQTYNNFPRTTVFIKDLVEAGLAFTGTGRLVFCFACGFTYGEWQDGDDPFVLHTKGNSLCPYLLGRRNNGASSYMTPNSFDRKVRYFWDAVNRCLVRQDSFSSLSIHVDLPNSPHKDIPVMPLQEGKAGSSRDQGTQNSNKAARFPPIEKKSGYENLPGALMMMTEENAKEKLRAKSPVSPVGKEVSSYFRNSENRLLSFTRDFPLLSKSQVHALADAGFFYPGNGDYVQCFSCNLALPDWQVFKNLIEVHIEKSPACQFARSLVRRSQRLVSTPSEHKDASNFMQENYKRETSVSQVSPRPEVLPSFHCPGPLPRQSKVTDDKGNEILPKIIMPTPTEISRLQSRQSPQQSGTSSSPMGYSPSQHHRYSPSQNTDPERSPFVANVSPLSGGSCMFHGMDMSQRNRRLQTYATWPQESPIGPFELALAGFYYTGYQDGVKCYSCRTALKDWCAQDTPWGEHIKWAPHCSLVKNYLQHHPQQGNAQTVTPDGYDRNSSREMGAETFHQGARVSLHSELSTPEYPRYEQDLLDNDRPDPIGNNQGQSALWSHLVDGKCIKDLEVLNNLCDMGYPCKLIKQVQDLYAAEYGAAFRNPDELVEAILCFQQDGHLKTFAKEAYNIPSHDKVSLSPVPSETVDNSNGQFIGPPKVVDSPSCTGDDEKVLLQQELEKAREVHQCKICMDEKISILFLPCGHLISCEICSSGLKDCPMCREPIEKFIRTYLS